MSTENLFNASGEFTRPDTTGWPADRVAKLNALENAATDAKRAETRLETARQNVETRFNAKLRADERLAAAPKQSHLDLVREMSGGTVGIQSKD